VIRKAKPNVSGKLIQTKTITLITLTLIIIIIIIIIMIIIPGNTKIQELQKITLLGTSHILKNALSIK